MEFTVEMAFVDYIPVAFFAIASIILMRDLFSKMSKLNFLIFALGVSGVTVAGACKATWKLLIAATETNIPFLNDMFFPTQSIGFLLAGIGLLAMLLFKKKATYGVNTFIFIGMMVAGLGVMDAILCVIAGKMKKPAIIAIFVLSFVCSLGMGYLSSKDFTDDLWNWIAEGINVAGQGSLLLGTYLLHKNGLKELEL
jgi:hypothetical protein